MDDCGVVDLTSDCEDDDLPQPSTANVPGRPAELNAVGSKRPVEIIIDDNSQPAATGAFAAAAAASAQPAPKRARVHQPAAAADDDELWPSSQPAAAPPPMRLPPPQRRAPPKPQQPVWQQPPSVPSSQPARQPARSTDDDGRVLTAAELKRQAAAEKKAAREAEKARKQVEKEQKALQKKLEREQKAAAKQAEKEERHRNKHMAQQARGRHAEKEVKAVLSTELAKLPVGHRIMEALTAKQLAYDIAPGRLAPLATISWTRSPCAYQGDEGCGAAPAPDAQSEDAVEVPYVLVYLKAEDFVNEVENGDVDGLIQRAAAAHPTCTLGLLVDGLLHYVEQRERREFRQAGPGVTDTFSRRKTDEWWFRLVTHYPGVRHRMVHDSKQAAEHIANLTRAMAKQPYQPQDQFLEVHGHGGDSSASASLLTRQPLPPDREALYRALSQVPALGPASSHVIASSVPSLGVLIAHFEEPSKSESEKLSWISEMKRPTDNSRRVGPAAARKLMRLLTSRDPDALVQD